MSPSGKYSPQREEKREKPGPEGPEGRARAEEPSRALPLRLSVARGGLGLELCEPVSLGPLVVQELEVALPGLTYPLDLSKGVKHFRNRRSVLRHAVVSVDLGALSDVWADSLADLFDEPLRVRIRSISETKRGAAENDSERTSALAVSMYGEGKALAFDLVITSGMVPGIAIDCPRAVGFSAPPLASALQVVDQGLAASSGGVLELRRIGRTVEFSGLCEALALLVLPSLGCRLPSVENQVVQDVRATERGLVITIGEGGNPFVSGRRALRVGLNADFLKEADEVLAGGDWVGARAAYLEALEKAPGHQESLLSVAEIDLKTGDRGEAALSFLQELEEREGQDAADAAARLLLDLGDALLQTGRQELFFETWARAAGAEPDAAVAALVRVQLAERSDDDPARTHLDAAVSRAPFLRVPRRLRFELALRKGDLKTASSDAEQLEALESSAPVRAQNCVRVGRAFLGAGHGELGEQWLRRGLRLAPDDPETMVELADLLAGRGQSLRAAELYGAALRRLSQLLDRPGGGNSSAADHGDTGPGVIETERLRAMQSRAHLRLARLLVEELDDEAQGLSHLAIVETRLGIGWEARLMEAELHHRAGRKERRDRSLSRLLEAIEMGWVRPAGELPQLVRFLERIGDDLDPSLSNFATRVVQFEKRAPASDAGGSAGSTSSAAGSDTPETE